MYQILTNYEAQNIRSQVTPWQADRNEKPSAKAEPKDKTRFTFNVETKENASKCFKEFQSLFPKSHKIYAKIFYLKSEGEFEKHADIAAATYFEEEEERKTERRTNRPISVEEMKSSILHWMEDSRLEVLCLVEGIESISSGTLQCRHSYSKDDILFDHEFEECVWEDDDGTGPTICFEKFHQVLPVSDRNAPWKTSSHLS